LADLPRLPEGSVSLLLAFLPLNFRKPNKIQKVLRKEFCL